MDPNSQLIIGPNYMGPGVYPGAGGQPVTDGGASGGVTGGVTGGVSGGVTGAYPGGIPSGITGGKGGISLYPGM